MIASAVLSMKVPVAVLFDGFNWQHLRKNHCLGYSITYPIMYTGSDVSYYLFDQLF